MGRGSIEGDNGSRSTEPFDADAYVDAADRLERAMDTQIQILEGIDTKAEHVTRLVALLIGILFSVISFVTQFDSTPFTPPPLEVLLAFGIGVWWLLASMCMAIITYLSSQYRIGLHGSVGEVLSDASYSVGLPEHIRNVLGTYSFVIGQNQQVIEANVFWFRLTLLFLLYGVLFVSLSGVLYIGGFGRTTLLSVVVVASIVSLGVGYYILSESFLPLRDEGANNE